MKNKFNFRLCQLLTIEKPTNDRVRELISDYRHLFSEASDLVWQLGAKTEEAKRLRHENEFLLRQIDIKLNEDSK